MPEYIRSVEELRELAPDAQEVYFEDLDVFSAEEWEIYKEFVDDYAARELASRTFTADGGTEYLLSVESDDETGPRINVVELDS